MVEYEDYIEELDDLGIDHELLAEVPKMKCAHCGRHSFDLNGVALIPDDLDSEDPTYYCELHSKLEMTDNEKQRLAAIQFLAKPILH